MLFNEPTNFCIVCLHLPTLESRQTNAQNDIGLSIYKHSWHFNVIELREIKCILLNAKSPALVCVGFIQWAAPARLRDVRRVSHARCRCVEFCDCVCGERSAPVNANDWRKVAVESWTTVLTHFKTRKLWKRAARAPVLLSAVGIVFNSDFLAFLAIYLYRSTCFNHFDLIWWRKDLNEIRFSSQICVRMKSARWRGAPVTESCVSGWSSRWTPENTLDSCGRTTRKAYFGFRGSTRGSRTTTGMRMLRCLRYRQIERGVNVKRQ